MRTNAATARTIVEPARRGVPPKALEMLRKYVRLLDLDVTPELVIRDRATSTWLGRYSSGECLIEIQKRVLFHEKSMERVIAHEVAHHADFLCRRKSKGITTCRPIDLDHGPKWQFFVDKINRAMGKDFVTVLPVDIVRAPETKPYVLMISRQFLVPLVSETSTFEPLVVTNAYQITPRMREFLLKHGSSIGARLIMSTDPRWIRGPKIAARRARMPKNEREHQDLHALYAKAMPVKLWRW